MLPEATFLPALACILVGFGFIKGNLAAQIGELCAERNVSRTSAFQVYNLMLQIAATISPLVCAFFSQEVSWPFAFGAAGAATLLGLAIYLAGLRSARLKEEDRRGQIPEQTTSQGSRDFIRTSTLILLVPVMALVWVGNQEIPIGYELWGRAHFALDFLGWKMPASYLVSLDAFISIVTAALSIAFWRWWGMRHVQPDEMSKVALGATLAAAAPFALALASMHQDASKASISLAGVSPSTF
ncbi:POT-type proton-dependent oligopeptide transporter [Sphingomonas morindae]|uniref:Uncharacterized protein n=1 Tax=Sphingomonas morindae TaxID=1541170 RepID=A0ABY4XB26_9SPHN|nr:hypothetical protein [Sphingomonas morindae]USI73886.1 hypothetical protein LHA26_05305 [Sphingomonas morindae]